MPRTRAHHSVWRFGVPAVCLCAGLLLGTTHAVSGGDEIRRSDAPRLVDLVREAQQSVDRLSGQRDGLATQLETHHGGSPAADAALVAITARADVLAVEAGLDPMRSAAARRSSCCTPSRFYVARREIVRTSRATPHPS